MRNHERRWKNTNPEKFLQNERQSYLEISKLIIGDAVLDAGCGNARLRKYIPDKKYTGLDITKNFIQYNKNECLDARFVEGSIIDLPWKTPTFGTGLTMSVFEHLHPDDVKPSLFGLLSASKYRTLIEFFRVPWDKPTEIKMVNGAYNNRYNKKWLCDIIAEFERFQGMEIIRVPPYHAIYKVDLK